MNIFMMKLNDVQNRILTHPKVHPNISSDIVSTCQKCGTTGEFLIPNDTSQVEPSCGSMHPLFRHRDRNVSVPVRVCGSTVLLKGKQVSYKQTSKLLIKLSQSSSTYKNTFAFQHFSGRRRAITFGLKERAILLAYSVRTILGSFCSSSVTITELPQAFLRY